MLRIVKIDSQSKQYFGFSFTNFSPVGGDAPHELVVYN